jgi:hypothetical protein
MVRRPGWELPISEGGATLHRAGGRYVTLVGSNPLFHLPQDRWPHAVDTDVVTRVAAAAAALVVKLTR